MLWSRSAPSGYTVEQTMFDVQARNADGVVVVWADEADDAFWRAVWLACYREWCACEMQYVDLREDIACG